MVRAKKTPAEEPATKSTADGAHLHKRLATQRYVDDTITRRLAALPQSKGVYDDAEIRKLIADEREYVDAQVGALLDTARSPYVSKDGLPDYGGRLTEIEGGIKRIESLQALLEQTDSRLAGIAQTVNSHADSIGQHTSQIGRLESDYRRVLRDNAGLRSEVGNLTSRVAGYESRLGIIDGNLAALIEAYNTHEHPGQGGLTAFPVLQNYQNNNQENGRRSRWPWLAGGALVIGGALVGAYLLLGGGVSSSGKSDSDEINPNASYSISRDVAAKNFSEHPDALYALADTLAKGTMATSEECVAINRIPGNYFRGTSSADIAAGLNTLTDGQNNDGEISMMTIDGGNNGIRLLFPPVNYSDGRSVTCTFDTRYSSQNIVKSLLASHGRDLTKP